MFQKSDEQSLPNLAKRIERAQLAAVVKYLRALNRAEKRQQAARYAGATSLPPLCIHEVALQAQQTYSAN
jgi:hypothetical protein